MRAVPLHNSESNTTILAPFSQARVLIAGISDKVKSHKAQTLLLKD